MILKAWFEQKFEVHWSDFQLSRFLWILKSGTIIIFHIIYEILWKYFHHEFKFSHHKPQQMCYGRGSQGDRQGKGFTKPLKLPLTVVFWAFDKLLLFQMERLEISDKVVLSPKSLPLKLLGRDAKYQQLTFEKFFQKS